MVVIWLMTVCNLEVSVAMAQTDYGMLASRGAVNTGILYVWRPIQGRHKKNTRLLHVPAIIYSMCLCIVSIFIQVELKFKFMFAQKSLYIYTYNISVLQGSLIFVSD